MSTKQWPVFKLPNKIFVPSTPQHLLCILIELYPENKRLLKHAADHLTKLNYNKNGKMLWVIHQINQLLEPASVLVDIAKTNIDDIDSYLCKKSLSDGEMHRLIRLACVYGKADVVTAILAAWTRQHGFTKTRAILDLAPSTYNDNVIDLHDFGRIKMNRFDPNALCLNGEKHDWMLEAHAISREDAFAFFEAYGTLPRGNEHDVLALLDTFTLLNRPILHCTTTLDSAKTLRLVLEAGANINALDCHGYTALHRCCLSRLNCDRKCIKLLLDSPSIDATTRAENRSPLHACISEHDSHKFSLVASHLVARGGLAANYDAEELSTLLSLAAEARMSDAVATLIEAGALLPGKTPPSSSRILSLLKKRGWAASDPANARLTTVLSAVDEQLSANAEAMMASLLVEESKVTKKKNKKKKKKARGAASTSATGEAGAGEAANGAGEADDADDADDAGKAADDADEAADAGEAADADVAADAMGDEEAPLSFVCPISHTVFRDPVITEDGQSYERICIEQWLQKNQTSPLTGAPLASKHLVPNVALRCAIREWGESGGGK